MAAAVLAGGALPPDAARFVWQPRSHGLDIGMRSINLLKVAAEAELLRLRALLARQGRRAAFGAVAAIFMLGVLVLAEITGWQVLRLYVAPIPTTLILLGINFAIAALFGALAARSSPSHTEREALQVRRQALDAADTFLHRGRPGRQRASAPRAPTRRASAIGVPLAQVMRCLRSSAASN